VFFLAGAHAVIVNVRRATNKKLMIFLPLDIDSRAFLYRLKVQYILYKRKEMLKISRMTCILDLIKHFFFLLSMVYIAVNYQITIK